MQLRYIFTPSAIAAALGLAACGGGTSGTYVPTPLPPITSSPTPSPSTSPVTPGSPSPSPSVAATPLTTATLHGTSGFVNAAGMTVYVFDADLPQANASTCNAACAGVWPPVRPPATSLPAGWSSFERQDGSLQLVYHGHALYTYIADLKPGDATGDGITAFGGLWHIARP